MPVPVRPCWMRGVAFLPGIPLLARIKAHVVAYKVVVRMALHRHLFAMLSDTEHVGDTIYIYTPPPALDIERIRNDWCIPFPDVDADWSNMQQNAPPRGRGAPCVICRTFYQFTYTPGNDIHLPFSYLF